MELIVIRHGQPRDESDGSGHGDPPLTALGKEQALCVALSVANDGVSHIISSPMKRALETAEPLARLLELEVETVEDLKESDWNAGPYRRVEENVDYYEKARELEPDFYYLPEGRQFFYNRVSSAFEKIASEHTGEKVAVFCHGMVIAALIGHTLGVELPDDKADSSYTGVTRIDTSRSQDWRLSGYNELSHLD